MPKYELMYILASSVSDDHVSVASGQVQKFVVDFGGTNVEENHLGKKKLAYPIKKTRNGYYVVVNFDMDTKRINEFDAKIRTQGNIIRYLLVNLEEHKQRLAKDAVEQSKLTKQPEVSTAPAKTSKMPTERKTPEPVIEIDASTLDKKIEEALTEDITK